MAVRAREPFRRRVKRELREILTRLVTYAPAALISLGANLLIFRFLLHHGMVLQLANGVAFFLGGQFNFLLQDKFVFRDRTLTSHWFVRWREFMGGNLAGWGLNQFAALLLSLTGLPDFGVWGGAMATSAVFDFAWIFYRSHRNREVRPKHNVVG